MLVPSALPLLILSLLSSVRADVQIITSAPPTTVAVAKRALISSASLACSTVSGLASPQPSGTTCGLFATSNSGGYIIGYSTGAYIQTLVSYFLVLDHLALTS
jgi:hypothetical protein